MTSETLRDSDLKALGRARETFACGSPHWLAINDAYSEIVDLRSRAEAAEAQVAGLRGLITDVLRALEGQQSVARASPHLNLWEPEPLIRRAARALGEKP